MVAVVLGSASAVGSARRARGRGGQAESDRARGVAWDGVRVVTPSVSMVGPLAVHAAQGAVRSAVCWTGRRAFPLYGRRLSHARGSSCSQGAIERLSYGA
jgi:hypothetical protein